MWLWESVEEKRRTWYHLQSEKKDIAILLWMLLWKTSKWTRKGVRGWEWQDDLEPHQWPQTISYSLSPWLSFSLYDCNIRGNSYCKSKYNSVKCGQTMQICLSKLKLQDYLVTRSSSWNGDICKNLRKSEHTIKKFTSAADEDKENQDLHARFSKPHALSRLQNEVRNHW